MPNRGRKLSSEVARQLRRNFILTLESGKKLLTSGGILAESRHGQQDRATQECDPSGWPLRGAKAPGPAQYLQLVSRPFCFAVAHGPPGPPFPPEF